MSFQDLSLLIVDDEIDILEIYEDLFGENVGTLIKASDGEDALEKFKNHNISVVVSDISMPKMNGIELLEKIRGLDKAVPFIIVTGYGDKQNAVKALRLGAFDFIDKPFDFEKIKKTVNAALESAQQIKLLNLHLGKVITAMQQEKNVVSRQNEILAKFSKK